MYDFHRQVSQILNEAHDKIAALNPGDFYMVQAREMSLLKQHINQLNTLIGDDPLTSTAPVVQPLTKMFGKTLVKDEPVGVNLTSANIEQSEQNNESEADSNESGDSQPPAPTAPELPVPVVEAPAPQPEPPTAPEPPKLFLTPLEVEAQELIAKLEVLYPQFCDIDNAGIKDTYSELEIRGVAKMAGLPVTETEPATITVKFLDQIKKAIKKKQEIAALGKTGE